MFETQPAGFRFENNQTACAQQRTDPVNLTISIHRKIGW
jgi:hypothetical protein